MNATFQRLYERHAPRFAKPASDAAAQRLDPERASIEGFRAAQRIAYAAATTVAAELRPGMTERDAARMLKKDLRARGAKLFLHRPFAWFGEHSRFSPNEGDFHAYHPTDMRLEEGMPFILDVSPIVNGYVADIGYSVCPDETPQMLAAKKFLFQLREDLPGLFASARTIPDIYDEVSSRMTDAGFANCHSLYPFRVLGHRVYRLGPIAQRVRPLRLPVELMGTDWFSLQALYAFAKNGVVKELLTAENNGTKVGLWAIEPHLGAGGFGMKFEEILAVTPDGRAFWIDDACPHVQEGRRRGFTRSAPQPLAPAPGT